MRSGRIAIAMTAFVVEHPSARFLVDPGMCSDVGTRVISQLPAVMRPAVRPPADAIPTSAALGADTVDFALPTHLHWDHVCGLLDLPSLPVRVHRSELDWITTGEVAPVGGVRNALHGRPIDTYVLDGPPVLTFERSHDLFGDGSVLLVDLAGHTPGSVGILINTASGRVLLAGHAALAGRYKDVVGDDDDRERSKVRDKQCRVPQPARPPRRAYQRHQRKQEHQEVGLVQPNVAKRLARQ
jgi:glyoxylase-like metal-dependent hydrolase (beta-lactamase superfamily II)